MNHPDTINTDDPSPSVLQRGEAYWFEPAIGDVPWRVTLYRPPPCEPVLMRYEKPEKEGRR